MPTSHRTPSVVATTASAAEFDADLLVVPLFEDDDPTQLAGVGAAAENIAAARARGELTCRLYEPFITTVPRGSESRRAIVIGAGVRAEVTADRLRRIATVAGLAARQRRVGSVAILQPSMLPVSGEHAAQAMSEGVTLANFEPASYKSDGPPVSWLDRADLLVPAANSTITAAVDRGRVLGECTNEARELSNEPGNRLTPSLFADRAAELARAAGLGVELLDEGRIEELKMGLLLGVSRGSAEPPRVLVLRHDPPGAIAGVLLGLVGKGVTFDTGGISIKPADNMDKMKDDMSGGAAVLGAMLAIARLAAPVRCLAVIPMTENMPGSRALKPGDVLTSAAGKTVEILNTDAEGRLILGDAVWYAREHGVTHLVDVATLTGACVVALGKSTSGLFGTPTWWVEQVRAASDRAGDRSWPMPVFDDYRELFKSDIADFSNTGGRAGGAITGALFVKEFSGDLPWVHMDIAGTAWAEEAKPYQPKGPTGVAVRTLAELALSAGSWGKLKQGT